MRRSKRKFVHVEPVEDPQKIIYIVPQPEGIPIEWPMPQSVPVERPGQEPKKVGK